MKMLSNTEAELKKSVAYKKDCVAQVERVRSKNNKKYVEIKIHCLMC